MAIRMEIVSKLSIPHLQRSRGELRKVIEFALANPTQAIRFSLSPRVKKSIRSQIAGIAKTVGARMSVAIRDDMVFVWKRDDQENK